MVLVHLTMRRIPGGARRTPPLQECLVGSKVFAEGGARLLCLSIPRKPKVRHTFMDGPTAQAGGELTKLCSKNVSVLGQLVSIVHHDHSHKHRWCGQEEKSQIYLLLQKCGIFWILLMS